MHAHSPEHSITLGDLVAAACDNAEGIANDQRTAASLASQLVSRWLLRAARQDLAAQLVRTAPIEGLRHHRAPMPRAQERAA
jgi:hypothetical protein